MTIATIPPQDNVKEWRPVSKEQERFLSSPAFEAFFGGAAGGGKSDCLVIEALRQIDNPHYNGIIFRRTFKMLEAAGGIIQRTQAWYPYFGGRYNIAKHVWEFPSGARIYISHMEHEDNKTDHQGAEYAYIAFDELTQFTESQYLYLFSRCRANVDYGLRAYIRSAGNPGGIGHLWVKKRFITSGITNKIAWFVRERDKDGKAKDIRADKAHIDAKSRVFFPALAKSNPKLSYEYIATLRAMDETDRARLEDGDWNAGLSEDRVYPRFSYEHNVSDSADYVPGYPIFWSVDDGYSNPRCILLWQERPYDGKPDRLCCFAEYYVTQELAATSIENILANVDSFSNQLFPEKYPLPEMIYFDPESPSFGAECRVRGLYTWGAFNKIHEGVKTVRRFICDHNQERRLMIHPRCENAVESMANLQRDKKNEKGGDPIPLKDGTEHAADSVRYFIATRYYSPDE